jgi:hypothetical protein
MKNDELVTLPVTNRSTTDRLWLVCIVSAWICMLFIGLAANGSIKSSIFQKGNPSLLIHGVDYEGNICGITSGTVKSLPNLIYPNFYGNNPSSDGDYVPPLTAICISSCPAAGGTITDPYGKYGSWSVPQDSVEFVNTCLYKSENRVATSGTTILSDFLATYVLIACLGFVLTIGLSFCFLAITRIPCFLRIVIWFCVFLVFFLCEGGGYFLLNEAKNQEKNNSNNTTLNRTEITLFNTIGSILCIAGILWIAFIAFFRKRISLAITLIKESAATLLQVPLLFLFPLIQTAIFAGFTCLWLYYTIYLVSSGQIITHVDSITGFSYKTIEYNENSKRAIVFMIFIWLWTIGFIEALGQLTASHTVLSWYFAVNRREITSLQVLSSFLIISRYHIGTAALGSLLISLLRMIRLWFEYMKYMLSKHSGDQINRFPLTRCFLSCFNCFLLFFEKFIKFLNKQSFIQCSMKGTDFIKSGRKAFFLLIKNIGRFAAVIMISDFVIIIGKIAISLSAATIGYLYMKSYMNHQLNGFILPTIFIFFLAYSTSTMFLNVLSSTTDTLLQACLVDEERQKKASTMSSSVSSPDDSANNIKHLILASKDQWKSVDNEDYDKYDENDVEDEEGEEIGDNNSSSQRNQRESNIDDLHEIELQRRPLSLSHKCSTSAPPPPPPPPPLPPKKHFHLLSSSPSYSIVHQQEELKESLSQEIIRDNQVQSSFITVLLDFILILL